jgi:hypothetical protein
MPVRLPGERITGRGHALGKGVDRGPLRRQPDTSAALAFAGCTGCDRCAHHCAHDNDVTGMLFARATAVRAGSPRAGVPSPCGSPPRVMEGRAIRRGARRIAGDPGEAVLAPAARLARGGEEVRRRLRLRQDGVPLHLAPPAAPAAGASCSRAGIPSCTERMRPGCAHGVSRGRRPRRLRLVRCAGDVLGAGTCQPDRGRSTSPRISRLLLAMPRTSVRRASRKPDDDPCALARGLRETVAPAPCSLPPWARCAIRPAAAWDQCCGASACRSRSPRWPGGSPRTARASWRVSGHPSPACAAALGATG